MLTSSLLSILTLFATPDTNRMGDLNLTITNIQESSGRIWVGVYHSEVDFLDREKARLVEAEVDSSGSLTIPILSLDYGSEYALAIFHDEDDDGEMNRNFFGLPAEPWAFSGEPRTRLRLPRFEEVKFCFKEGREAQVVRLRLW